MWEAAPLLLIDWSGDDVYPMAAATDGRAQRVSVAIDLAGNDRYTNDERAVGNFAAGHCGIGMLFDFAGDDRYSVPRNGPESRSFRRERADGRGRQRSLRGGREGTGLRRGRGPRCSLTSPATTPTTSTRDGQGNGQPGGVGVLADLAGDDHYVANDTDIRFPSPQSSEHNVSMAQGAGHGWRGDYRWGRACRAAWGCSTTAAATTSIPAAFSGRGSDTGCGSGILIDRHGDDTYAGQWYVQGAAAHFAAGVLLEGDGNDRYAAKMNMSHGAGHDVGVGLLADLAGDDVYHAGTLSLGAGNASGIGIFMDCLGDDSYADTTGTNNMGYATPNRADSIRKVIPGYGLFLELGGADKYPADRGGDGKTWSSEPGDDVTVLPGVGRGVDSPAEESDGE